MRRILTRRDMLATGVKAGGGLVLANAGRMLAFDGRSRIAQQAPQSAQRHPGVPDEMTTNTMQHQEHFPPPDFGPLPSVLPLETKAIEGKHSLKEHARRQGLIAGAAVVIRGLQRDPVLQELVAEQYGILVPEAELKWVALRPSKDQFNFEASDALFAFAEQHKMLVRGHTFVWHNSVPDWLLKSDSGVDVRQLLVEHIQAVAGRYRGRVHSWDVVNEAILPKDGQDGGLRKSFWFERIGPDYIELAFRTAREADPHAKLTYNEYGVEYDNEEETERRRLVLALLRRMQEKKVPLDAVGIQSHIKAASPSTIGKGLSEYIEAIRAMGLEVYLTELDVNEDDIVSNDIAIRDREVAETYRRFLDVALANPAVKLALTWGVSDRRTWLNDGPTHHRKQPDRPQRSLPFDPAYKPTEAFFAIRNSIDVRRKSHT